MCWVPAWDAFTPCHSICLSPESSTPDPPVNASGKLEMRSKASTLATHGENPDRAPGCWILAGPSLVISGTRGVSEGRFKQINILQKM